MTGSFLPRTALLLAALLALASPAAAQHRADVSSDSSVFRPLDLPTPNLFRTATGAPGSRYWQQRADYRIEAALDTAEEMLSGRTTISYRNNSPDTLRHVWLQVDQNLYRPGSLGAFQNPAESRWGARNFQGGIDLSEVRVGAVLVRPYIWDTMMRIDLPRPLAPGASVVLAMAWRFRIPEYGSDRMARQGDLYEIAQWSPRMAVYDDVRGWNTQPYLGQGEFYREYGTYDVAITVPAGFIVAATGTLQNPVEVLTAEQRARLARAARDTAQVAIISAAEVGTPGTRPRTTGTLTWRFHADSVPDFAWAASPRFRWDSESWNGVQCHAYHQPDATAWTTAADMTCFSIREFSTRWFRYPWAQATSVAGPVGGMEYPMFVMVHATGDERSVFGTIAHEHGHEWYPMLVHNQERLFAWMDEGFNTFIDTWANDLRYPGTDTRTFYRQQVERFRDQEGGTVPLMTPPDRIPPPLLGVTAYRKPAYALHLLRDEVLGPEAFDAAFREYTRRWAFHHPTPADFFRTMEDVSGRDLAWFWRGWFLGSEPLDLAVEAVGNTPLEGGRGFAATIRIAARTGVVMPVTLRLTLADGQARDIRLPESVWYGGSRYTFALETPVRVSRAELDPLNRLPDRDRTNNRHD
jgi:hypothetical protein